MASTVPLKCRQALTSYPMQVLASNVGSESVLKSSTQPGLDDAESRLGIIKPEILEETVREEPGLELSLSTNQLDAQVACEVGWTLEDIEGASLSHWPTGNVNTNLSLTEPPGQAGSDLRDGDTQVFLTSVTTCPYPCTFPALLHPGKDGRFLLYVQAACIRTVRCHEIESGMNGKLK